MHHSSERTLSLQGARVLVTGATGMLGSNLVRALVARGAHVRGLVRSPEKARRYLADVAFEPIAGDMREVSGFAAALEDCSAVFHTAAYFREYYQPGSHDGALASINVQGTLELMRAADAAGVSCFVHVSSSGTIGLKPDGSPGDEDTPPSAAQLDNGYFRSKVEGDRQIHAFAPARGMRVIEILPGWMWGPGDAAPTAAGQMVLDFVQRKIPVVPEGGTCVVDARDVAGAMLTAAERAPHASRYIVGGEFRSLAQLLQALEVQTGIAAPRLHLPFFMVLAFAYLEELRVRITGGLMA